MNILRILGSFVACTALCCTPCFAADEAQPHLGTQIGSAMTAGERSRRDAVIETILDKEIGRLAKQISTNSDISTRDLTNGALYHLERGGAPADAEALLRRLFALQNMDASSKDYGYIPWKSQDPTVHDANSIEFDMQAMGAIFMGFGDKLSDGFKRDARPHLLAALTALASHQIPVSYTNIYLMNTVNTLTLGQYLNDASALTRGRQQWATWREYTAHNGIHEFDSPTYYAVDVADLTLGFRYIKDPAIHTQIVAVLNYFFTDIANNFSLSAERLAGPHSRDYNFLNGWGGLNFVMLAEGVVDDPKTLMDVFLEKVAVIDNDRAGGYHPSPEILRQMEAPVRTLQQRWDENTALYRYAYFTPQFAMGSTDGAYSPQDKLFAADYAGRPAITTSVVIDSFDQPYGLYKQVDRSGHSKSFHLPANLSSVQEKNTALLVYDLNPAHDSISDAIATNLLLPATADEVLLNGTAVTVSSKLDLPVEVGAVVAVRHQNSCLAASMWHVDALQQLPVSLHLKADAIGLSHGAFRLVAYHGQANAGKGPADHLHVAILVRMDACTDDKGLRTLSDSVRNAVVTALPGKDTWTATAKLAGLQLALTEDTRNRLPISRTVNGQEMPTPVFAINGTPVTF